MMELFAKMLYCYMHVKIEKKTYTRETLQRILPSFVEIVLVTFKNLYAHTFNKFHVFQKLSL